jgi:Arc/MetJ-type ribon-helix-helix transcriptional regulator
MTSHVYSFPPDLEQRVKARMAGGHYQTEDEVLREALDALEEKERSKTRRWHERNQTAMDQSRAGLSKPLDLAGVLNRVERRLVAEDQGE